MERSSISNQKLLTEKGIKKLDLNSIKINKNENANFNYNNLSSGNRNEKVIISNPAVNKNNFNANKNQVPYSKFNNKENSHLGKSNIQNHNIQTSEEKENEVKMFKVY
jgi:hypothetical protein